MSRTILLADDSLTIQKVVELTFANTDYRVVAVSRGDDLLRQLPEVRPDLIICDIIMPGKDGYEVCQEIKSNPVSLHIPVILLSGTFEPFDRDRALAAGCSDIITKPFEARKLVETVQRLVVHGMAEPAPAAFREPLKPPPIAPVAVPLGRATPARVVSEPAATAQPLGLDLDEERVTPEQGLDFTDSGFSEMEEAGWKNGQGEAEAPADGLDFEFSDEFEAFGRPAEDQEPEAYQTTQPEVTATTGGGFAAGDALPEPWLEPEPQGPPPAEVQATPDLGAFAEPVPATEVEARRPAAPAIGRQPRVQPDLPGADWLEAGRPAMPGPFLEAPFETAASSPTEPFFHEPEPAAIDVIDQPSAAAPYDDGLEVVEPGEAAAPAPGGIAPPAFDVAGADLALTEADTAPVRSPAAARPVEARPEVPLARGEVVVSSLSDADVDRIARRLLELAAERIEHIAWEIVPDMAEIVVRQRIRELEADAEGSLAQPPS